MPEAEWEGEERKRILSLVRLVSKAIEKKDAESILPVYDTYDKNFCTFEDTVPYSRVDGAQFRNFVRGLANLQSASIDRQDVRVDFITRNVAIVTGMDDWEIKQNNNSIKGRSRFTIVFRKRRAWKAIHEHFTRIPEDG
jgi:hypothetical protein